MPAGGVPTMTAGGAPTMTAGGALMMTAGGALMMTAGGAPTMTAGVVRTTIGDGLPTAGGALGHKAKVLQHLASSLRHHGTPLTIRPLWMRIHEHDAREMRFASAAITGKVRSASSSARIRDGQSQDPVANQLDLPTPTHQWHTRGRCVQGPLDEGQHSLESPVIREKFEER